MPGRLIIRLDMVFLTLGLALVLAFVQPAQALDAKHCIVAEVAKNPLAGKDMMSLHNKCEREVFVVWCHDGTGSGRCNDEKFFRKGRRMDSNERVFNRYSLPNGRAVHFGACFGGSRSNVRLTKDNSRYACRSDRIRGSCADGAKRRFTWEVQHANDTQTFIKVVSGDTKSHFRLEAEEFKTFTDNPEAPTNAVMKRLCAPADEKSRSKKIHDGLKKEVQDELDERRAQCAAKSNEGPECKVYREPPIKKPSHMGVKG